MNVDSNDQCSAAAKRPREEEEEANEESGNNTEKKPKTKNNHDYRVCFRCKENKALSSEYSRNQQKKGDSAKCKSCILALQQQQQQQAPTKTVQRQQSNVSNNNNNTGPIVCASCKKSKQQSQYTKGEKKKHAQAGGSAGLATALCKVCFHQQRREKDELRRQQDELRRQQEEKEKLLCSVCNYRKLPKQFLSNQDNKDGGESLTCQSCYEENKPRKCSKCQVTKSKECFSARMWRNPKTQYTCLECMPALQQENWNDAAKNVFEPLSQEGIHFYDFDVDQVVPKLVHSRGGGEWNHPLKDSTLAGTTYDLLYHYGYAGDYEPSRTTRGTLTFRMTAATEEDEQEREEEQSGEDDNVAEQGEGEQIIEHHDGNNDNETTRLVLTGQIEFDKSLPKSDCLYFDRDYTIVARNPGEDDGDQNDDGDLKRTFSIKGMDQRLADFFSNRNEPKADLRVIRERIAFPWRPLEGRDLPNLEEDFGSDKLITFGSLEQAEELVKEHKNKKAKELLPSFPQEVAKHILAFTPSSSPVLFLEPGDLFLETTWVGYYHDGAASFIVARRRRHQCINQK